MKHIDPSEINIINYLAGEMTNEELKQFRHQLRENQLLRTQVEEMEKIRNQMRLWKDEDIRIPTFESLTSTPNTRRTNSTSNIRKLQFPNWVKYAAVFLGFVLLSQITGFQVSQNDNTLMLSFGAPNMENPDVHDIDVIVAKAIDKYAKEQSNDLSTFKNQIDTDLSTIAAAVEKIAVKHETNLEQLEGIFNQNMDGQYVRLESMIRNIEDNQRQDLEDSFTGFVEFIENKRAKDQYKIQNAFSEIATAINNQQYQTNALLTSISEDDPGLKSY